MSERGRPTKAAATRRLEQVTEFVGLLLRDTDVVKRAAAHAHAGEATVRRDLDRLARELSWRRGADTRTAFTSALEAIDTPGASLGIQKAVVLALGNGDLSLEEARFIFAATESVQRQLGARATTTEAKGSSRPADPVDLGIFDDDTFAA